jgi:hypothetical protein
VQKRLNTNINERILFFRVIFFPCDMCGIHATFIDLVLVSTSSDLDFAELAPKRELDPITTVDVQWKTAAFSASLGCYAGGGCKDG